MVLRSTATPRQFSPCSAEYGRVKVRLESTCNKEDEMNRLLRPALAASMALLLSACSTAPTKQDQGMIIGAIAGGILGHQVGGGSGQVLATMRRGIRFQFHLWIYSGLDPPRACPT